MARIRLAYKARMEALVRALEEKFGEEAIILFSSAAAHRRSCARLPAGIVTPVGKWWLGVT